MDHKFKTVVIWHDSRGSEREASVIVTYCRHKGFAGDRIDPPEPDNVEIVDIIDEANPGDRLPDHIFQDDALIQECFDHWNNDEIEAAEWREQSRRDSLMGGF